MKRIFIFSLLFVVVFPSSFAAEAGTPSTRPGNSWLKRCRAADWIRYSSDFEDVVIGTGHSQSARLANPSVSEPCPDATPLLSRIALGSAQIEYEGGTDSQRAASVVTDPSNPSNQVLRFWMGSPHVANHLGEMVKGRIQLNIYNNTGAREILLVVRARLSGGFSALTQYNRTVDWLTISEWWNNAPWTGGGTYPFRISVNIVKDEKGPNQPLLFSARAQTIDMKESAEPTFTDVWSQTQRRFTVPLDRWMTIRYHLIEGNAATGLFRMTVRPDGEREFLVFDIRGATHHPADPAPDGFKHINPLKVYAAASVINQARSTGKNGLTIDWDDLTIKVRETPGPISTRAH